MSLSVLVLLLSCFCLQAYSTCSSCPARWTEYNGNCYRYFGFRKSWTQAELFCDTVAARGYSYGSAYQTSSLVSIHSQAEQNFVYSYWYSVRCPGGNNMWIGLNDLQRNRRFQWTNGRIVDYTNWAPGEPNNANGREHYGVMWGNGKWNDGSEHSSHLFPYMCKMPRE